MRYDCWYVYLPLETSILNEILQDTMYYSETIQFCVGSPKNLTGGLYITPVSP
jgi:hypothetical protein